MSEFFVGGSAELSDLSYVTTAGIPQGPSGVATGQSGGGFGELRGSQDLSEYALGPQNLGPAFLTKYGFKTEPGGSVKVRMHTAIQAQDYVHDVLDQIQRNSPVKAPYMGAVSRQGVASMVGAGRRSRKETSLKVCLDLADAAYSLLSSRSDYFATSCTNRSWLWKSCGLPDQHQTVCV